MPSKGFTYSRNNVLSKTLYDKFIEDSGIDISYATFREIILESNQTIFDIICNDAEGFKIPENMGYWVVTKYKSKKKATDWINSKKYKRAVYLTNLHSFGYIHHIKWCKFAIARFKFANIYKFEAARFLKRKVAKNVKEGKAYFNWQNSDFWSTSKLDRMYNRKYKTES